MPDEYWTGDLALRRRRTNGERSIRYVVEIHTASTPYKVEKEEG